MVKNFAVTTGTDAANGGSLFYAYEDGHNCVFWLNHSEYYDYRGLYNPYTSGTILQYFCPIGGAISDDGYSGYAKLTPDTLDGVWVAVYDGNNDDDGYGYEVTAVLCYVDRDQFNFSCGSSDSTSNYGYDILYPGLPPSYHSQDNIMFIEGYYPYKDNQYWYPDERISFIKEYVAYDSSLD